MRKIDGIYTEIEALHEEIKQIRMKCTHPSYKVGWHSWRVGSMNPKRLCTECDEVLEGITEEEAKALRDELYGKVGQSPSTGFIMATEEKIKELKDLT
ncbi:Uncharacterised protein [uncultured archaeon]|nr:Uncharacterised protein [uncultured archaeon]